MHNSIRNNLTTLMLSGAFDYVDDLSLEPMSPFKWRTLVKAADRLGITGYIAFGAQNLRDDANISPLVTSLIPFQKDYSLTDASLFNHFTDMHLMEVREEEMNAPDTSEATLLLLDTIVANTHAIIIGDVSIEGMLSLGRMIRGHSKSTVGGKVESLDYEKLSSWLSTIGLVQVANLLANMLVECLRFSPEEIPFYRKKVSNASKHFYAALYNALGKHSFSIATRMNIAMTETLSYNFVSAISRVTDIEE